MKYKSAEHKKAIKEHETWKRKMGISKPKRTSYKGGKFKVVSDYGRQPDLPPTSDSCAYVPTRDKYKDKSLIKAIEEKAVTVAPSFNKGPLQPQTSNDLFESRRR